MKTGKEYRKLTGRVVIATHNPGKLKEMQELLSPYGIEAQSAGELGLPVPVENGFMFSQNAMIKAKAAAEATALPALSDDSGLCIDVLDGAPGLFSADWAGDKKDFALAMNLVRNELEKRGLEADETIRAHFVSALVLYWPDGHSELFEGRIFGHIVWPPRGERGFGYDSIFQPDGHEKTFGELSSEEKHGIDYSKKEPEALSHRARAFLALAKHCLP